MYGAAPHVADESTASCSPCRINIIDQPCLSTRHCTIKSSLSDLSVSSKCPWQSFCWSTALAAAFSCENQVTSHDAVAIPEKSRNYFLRSGAEPAVYAELCISVDFLSRSVRGSARIRSAKSMLRMLEQSNQLIFPISVRRYGK